MFSDHAQVLSVRVDLCNVHSCLEAKKLTCWIVQHFISKVHFYFHVLKISGFTVPWNTLEIFGQTSWTIRSLGFFFRIAVCWEGTQGRGYWEHQGLLYPGYFIARTRISRGGWQTRIANRWDKTCLGGAFMFYSSQVSRHVRSGAWTRWQGSDAQGWTEGGRNWLQTKI